LNPVVQSSTSSAPTGLELCTELYSHEPDGTEAELERAFVAFSAAYNAFVEGVLTMPSYEIVIYTTDSWDAFRLILMDEGATSPSAHTRASS
jgi:hypothetical protein